MANKKQVSNSNKKNTPALSGHNIYKDKHGQTIYFNKKHALVMSFLRRISVNFRFCRCVTFWHW